MIFGFIYLLTIICLLLYMNYSLQHKDFYIENVVRLLRIMVLLLNWVFFLPFYESFISILQCNNGIHYLDQSVQCFQGIHFFYVVICVIFLIILVSISIIVAMLYNET